MTMCVKVQYHHFSLKKITHGTAVIGASSLCEVLESGQLTGAPVVTSL